MDSIITAIITGGITLLGVLIANSKNQAVMETKVDELTREVREHNHFAQRLPLVEHDVKDLQRRVGALEGYHKQPVNPVN